MTDEYQFVRNIYYMLSYVFRVLHQKQYASIATETFDHIENLFAAILEKAVTQQLKRGLYQEYVSRQEIASALRGKLDLKQTIQLKLSNHPQLACKYDELTDDHLYNQIIRSTMYLLYRYPRLRPDLRQALHRLIMRMGKIQLIDLKSVNWEQLQFHRQNATYEMLLNICYMVVDDLLLSQQKGKHKVAHYMDDQKFYHLYEKFILAYYQYHHPELHPSASQIQWHLDDQSNLKYLPKMQSDIVLHNHDRTLIIDAKCYSYILRSNYDKDTISSANLYQIYTYVKNGDRSHSGKVSGMLLYAKTNEDIVLDQDYLMDGNRISIRSLDLNETFELIQEQLEKIASFI